MSAHDNLEEFTDPPNYDLEEGERSAPRIEFYCDLAKSMGGPVLEIACGSGLVTIPIAANGLDVTGVDLARPMLEHARKKAEAQNLNIRWVEADARSLNLGTQYKFILLTGNAFQAFLQREDQEALFESVKRHLAPHGVFAFETRNPSGHDLTSQAEEEFDQSYTSVEGHLVSVSFKQTYDPLAQTIYWTSYRRWNDG
jgi:ubiquinone/menaquinone biosynthesis C-methylase UbiE